MPFPLPANSTQIIVEVTGGYAEPNIHGQGMRKQVTIMNGQIRSLVSHLHSHHLYLRLGLPCT